MVKGSERSLSCYGLYRDEVYDADTDEPGVGEIIPGKQRNGQTGTAKVQHQAKITRFENFQEVAMTSDKSSQPGEKLLQRSRTPNSESAAVVLFS